MPLPTPADLAPMLALLLAAGAVTGLIAGLLGVGGGFLLVPAFYFVFLTLGYHNAQLMQICLATSLATIVVTSARSVASHRRHGAVDWEILRRWGPWIGAGAVLGVLVATRLRSATLVLVFGTLAMAMGLYLLVSRPHWRLGARMPGGWRRLVLAPLIGLLSVLLGIGGAAFGVPLMTLHGVSMHRAVGTGAGFGMLVALPSVTGFLLAGAPAEGRPPLTFGHVNLVALAVIVAMTLITAPIGARLSQRLSPAMLKRVFAVFLIAVAVNMLRRAWTG